MAEFVHGGGCRCGVLRWALASRQPLPALQPRACDCDFCTRHGAAWVSDAAGSLRITGLHEGRRHRQGSGQAEFLFCGRCSDLVAVLCAGEDDILRGAVNRSGFDQHQLLGDDMVVSPQRLAPEAKRARWSQVWTPAILS